ncbi:hypothetical protein BN6_56950 [Saccharothrix espanaensis DSM 44229]|uniref:Uncharacterized protein n=1 Tax=Saccharothrix espanaensis (strain ATCC 51144 / DSM 44229 / JCM 9112 / NBRC 15066 / NRRL 15764) TaxID=1179773 RepID=K0K7V4_SACES|nr:hypothetical protein BN6_56950 [Saccharothrix espanaensis DSM 44229]
MLTKYVTHQIHTTALDKAVTAEASTVVPGALNSSARSTGSVTSFRIRQVCTCREAAERDRPPPLERWGESAPVQAVSPLPTRRADGPRWAAPGVGDGAIVWV